MSRLALILAIAGCSSSSTTTSPVRPPAPGAIAVDIASVSLAEDCGTGAKPADPVRGASRPNPASEAASQSADYAAGEAACEQTTMQLTVKSGPGGGAGTLQIKRVELLDANGKRVGTLSPRSPSRWVESDYQPWNERIEAGQQLTASYALSAPNWAELPGGRDPSVAYRVRVTIAIGGEERTFDKPATIEGPALPLPPGVVT